MALLMQCQVPINSCYGLATGVLQIMMKCLKHMKFVVSVSSLKEFDYGNFAFLGTYSSTGDTSQGTKPCIPCPSGTYSWEFAQNCFAYTQDLFGGFPFRLQDQGTYRFITQHNGVAVMMSDNIADPNQILMYNPSTMQISNPSTKLCLDDQGGQRLGGFNNIANVIFNACDSASPNQKFIYSSSRIYNAYSPWGNICWNGDGNINAQTGTNEVMLWNNDAVNANEDFVALIACNPGEFHRRLLKICNRI